MPFKDERVTDFTFPAGATVPQAFQAHLDASRITDCWRMTVATFDAIASHMAITGHLDWRKYPQILGKRVVVRDRWKRINESAEYRSVYR